MLTERDVTQRVTEVAKEFPHFTTPCLVTPHGDGHTWHVTVALDPGWCTACEEERQGYAQGLVQAVRRDLGVEIRVTIR
jgi:hypothetical protein